MTPAIERKLLQVAVVVACVVPLAAGLAGALGGPRSLRGIGADVPADLDSHFRYLSGLLFALGIGFVSCVPRIERRTRRFQLLGAIVVTGGIARLLGFALADIPSPPHRLALVMELVVVPLLMFWQVRVAVRASTTF